MTKILLFTVTILFLFSGCKQDNLTPSWLNIDEFLLETDETYQGANSTKITDAWVYMDGQPLGVFELPANIPILAEGEHSFIIFAGIMDNGRSGERTIYPFYRSYDIDLNLVINDTIAITPVTEYKAATTFAFIEDFESAGFDIVKGAGSDTNITFITKEAYPEIVKYGNKCGGIFLDEIDSLYVGRTNENFILPTNQDVYLEIDYRNDNSMTMSTIYEDNGDETQELPYITMVQQTTGEEVWKKMYINLKENISFRVGADNYDVYFLSILDNDKVTGTFYLDNIKIVHN